MITPLHCIALNTVKFNDRHNILTVYSEEMGRVSLLISAGASKSAKRVRALTSPLSRFECIGTIFPNREIIQVKDIKLQNTDISLRTNPLKITIALFITEILSLLLRETQQDNKLFLFLSNAIDILEKDSESIANYPIVFLYTLSVFLGIAPDPTSYHPQYYFDMVDGIFRPTPPLHRHFLSIADSMVMMTLSRISFRNYHQFKFTRKERNEILDFIISYYDLHYTSLARLKSLDILRQL